MSSNNAVFNAHAYASADHTVVAIKATEGATYNNPRHVPWTQAAHSAGLSVGHYHFCRPEHEQPVRDEAAHFWRSVRPHFTAGDFLVLDLETAPAGDPRRTVAYLRSFDDLLIHHSGQEAVAYTYLSFLREAGAGLQVASQRWWIACYGAGVPDLGAGRRLWAHQYTDGSAGVGPRHYAGVGFCDGSLLNRRSARRFRRLRDRRRQGRA